MDFEAVRESYRPSEVRLLFVGESLPVGGTFLYHGDSNLARYTFEAVFGRPGSPEELRQFPSQFRDRGYYLVDLCIEPVNGMAKPERRLCREAGIEPLSHQLAEIRPAAIVVVMKAIRRHVERAVMTAGLECPLSAVPFPAFGHQRKYVEQLGRVIAGTESSA